MKKTVLTLVVLIITVVALHAFRVMQDTTISGRITPPDGAVMIWAINNKDSAKAVPHEGAFVLKVKPGTWRLIVQGKEPYKDAILETVQAKEAQNTDVGEIHLEP